MSRIKEKDIEYWLWESPECVTENMQWLARQYRVPSGIIDLLGLDGFIYVVEVKAVPINSKAIAQTVRYMGDIREILETIYRNADPEYKYANNFDSRYDVRGLIVGTKIQANNVVFEAAASGIQLYTFDIDGSILHGPWTSKRVEGEQYKNKIIQLAQEEIWRSYNESCQQTIAIIKSFERTIQ